MPMVLFLIGLILGLGPTPTLADPAAPAAPAVTGGFNLVGRSPYLDDTEDAEIELYEETPGADRHEPPPKPFVTLTNAADFILAQRGRSGHGLPATFYVPAGTLIPHPLRRLIISEGVGLYDTALAVMTLVGSNHLPQAREILDLYASGFYAEGETVPMWLRAYPTELNGYAFAPFDEKAYYFFDFTNVNGDWKRWGDQWKFWTAHTGPNAWMVLAIGRYVEVARQQGAKAADLKKYIEMAHALGHAMQRLQDDEALGGVRYAPKNTYYQEEASDPYLEINSENNVSAYAAFQTLYRITGDASYQKSAEKIVAWFTQAPIWDAQGKSLKGLYEPASGTLGMGAEYHGGKWVLQPEHPTDSGGTITLSSLGPEKIDALWGAGAAYKMWRSLCKRAGVNTHFCRLQPGEALAGLDYTDSFSEKECLISPEWSSGGLFALKQLVAYYGSGKGRGVLTTKQLAGLRRDSQTMFEFLRQKPNAYALGPGHGGERLGRTGFRWFSPPPSVTAMASVYFALYTDGQPDPVGWWRSTPPPHHQGPKFD